MNTYDMKDRVAIITGGAQGIGLAVAEKLAVSGAKIVLWDVDEGLASAEASRLGGQAVGTDVTDEESVARATQEVMDRFGRIDALVTSAGIAGPNMPLAEYPLAEWRKIMAINIDGTFLCCRAVLPHMREAGFGRIVTIGSVAGKDGNPNASAYSTSKGAVIAMTKSMGKENADLDIAVNCVTPAAARTRIFDQMSEDHIAFMLSKIPRGRFLEVSEAAEMIVWLLTPENSFTTGGIFDLSGGRATY